MKRILLTISIILMACSVSFAKEPFLDAETKEICNKVLLNLYYDILDQKDKYEELANFGETALYENKHGIIAIVYRFDDGKGDRTDKPKAPYEFGVTIEPLKDKTFSYHEGAFNYGFNVLGLKISGYQKKYLRRSQLDILPFIQNEGNLLSDHQQKYMPLRIFLESPKDSYFVREDIKFSLILKNVSKRHMIVKSLGMNTLYFLVDGRSWGASSSKGKKGGGKKVILRAGESLQIDFRGESFQRPQDIIINGFYKMLIDGAYPTASLKIKIVDAP